METRPQAQISIICVGEAHSDPVAKLAILSTIKKFHENNIPVVYCAEKPVDSNLIDRYNKLNIEIKGIEGFIEDSKLYNFFYNSDGQALPWFNKENTENFKLIISQSLKDENLQFLNDICNTVITYPVKRAVMNLLNYILENSIKYAAIDIQQSEANDLSKLLYSAKNEEEKFNIMLNHELHRISIMIDSIDNKAIKPLQNTGGIIICHVGSIHAHRLAAHLYAKYNISSVIALNCYSDEHAKMINFDTDYENILQMKIDSPAIKEIYETIPYAKLHFPVTENNEFYNEKFDEIITSHINTRKIQQMVPDDSAINIYRIR